jgi:hypothetical protein
VNAVDMLLFRGRPLDPPVHGHNSLDLDHPFRIGETDVVRITDNGGTACPFLYCFVITNKSGGKATPSFGTCNSVKP